MPSPTGHIVPSRFSSLAYREKFTPESNRLGYDPRITQAWESIRFRQTVAMIIFPSLSIILSTLLFTFGNLSLDFLRSDLKSVALVSILLNLLLLPFSLVNYRCPNCGLYVTGNHPTQSLKLHHYLVNLRVKLCPNCHTRLS